MMEEGEEVEDVEEGEEDGLVQALEAEDARGDEIAPITSPGGWDPGESPRGRNRSQRIVRVTTRTKSRSYLNRPENLDSEPEGEGSSGESPTKENAENAQERRTRIEKEKLMAHDGAYAVLTNRKDCELMVAARRVLDDIKSGRKDGEGVRDLENVVKGIARFLVDVPQHADHPKKDAAPAADEGVGVSGQVGSEPRRKRVWGLVRNARIAIARMRRPRSEITNVQWETNQDIPGRKMWDPMLRFTIDSGGAGATPLHQLILTASPQQPDSEASVCAACEIVKQWPDLLFDTYGDGPYEGENCLHMAIIKGCDNRIFDLFKDERPLGGPLSTVRSGLHKLMSDSTTGSFFSQTGLCYYGGFPLAFAVASGSLERIEWLLDEGADPEAMDQYGNTAFHIAVLYRRGDAYEFMRQGYNRKKEAAGTHELMRDFQTDILNHDSETPTMLALRLGDPSMFELCVKVELIESWEFGTTTSRMVPIGQITGIASSSTSKDSLNDTLYNPSVLTGLEIVVVNRRRSLILPTTSAYDCAKVTWLGLEKADVFERSTRGRPLASIFLRWHRWISTTFLAVPDKIFRFSLARDDPPDEARASCLIVSQLCWATYGKHLFYRHFALYFFYLATEVYSVYYSYTTAQLYANEATGLRTPDGERTPSLFHRGRQVVMIAGSVYFAVYETIATRASLKVMTGYSWYYYVVLMLNTILVFAACVFGIADEFLTDSRSEADEYLFSMAVICGCFYLLNFLQCYQVVGPIIAGTLRILISDVLPFVMIFSIMIFAFAGSMYVLARGRPVIGFDYPGTALMSTFRMTFLSYDYEQLQEVFYDNNASWTYVTWIYILWIVVAAVVLLNIIIAMVTHTYTGIRDWSVAEFLLHRTDCMLRLERMMDPAKRRERQATFTTFKNDIPYVIVEKHGAGVANFHPPDGIRIEPSHREGHQATFLNEDAPEDYADKIDQGVSHFHAPSPRAT